MHSQFNPYDISSQNSPQKCNQTSWPDWEDKYSLLKLSTALDNEDLINATPQPNFTPNSNPYHTGKVPEMYSDSETQEITDGGEYVYPLPDSLSLRMSPQLPKGWLRIYPYLSQKGQKPAPMAAP